VLSTQLNKHIDFDQLTPVIVVSVMDFILFQRHDRYLSHHWLTDQFDGIRDLNLLEFHYIELPKFKKNENELTTDLERWVFFLSYASQYMDLPQKIAHSNEAIADAFDIVSIQNWTKAELELYEMHLDAVRCRRGELKTERRLGKKEGEYNNACNVARKMLTNGFSIQDVALYTGLSIDQIKELK
jgi:predicted transposase/invertase (TIGR01784 family)